MSSAVPKCAVFGHGSLLLHSVIAWAEIWKLLVVGGGLRLYPARAHVCQWAKLIPVSGSRRQKKVSINWTCLRVRGIVKPFDQAPFGSLFHMHSLRVS
jgi:hypothetical protein